MLRTLIMATALVACICNPASAEIVCGPQPTVSPSSSAEGFKADATGKAQLLSKILPSAEINGKIEQWKTEQRQQYKDLDQHELTFYWVWVSCQMINHSKEMTDPQKNEQWGKVRAAFSQPVPAACTKSTILRDGPIDTSNWLNTKNPTLHLDVGGNEKIVNAYVVAQNEVNSHASLGVVNITPDGKHATGVCSAQSPDTGQRTNATAECFIRGSVEITSGSCPS